MIGEDVDDDDIFTTARMSPKKVSFLPELSMSPAKGREGRGSDVATFKGWRGREEDNPTPRRKETRKENIMMVLFSSVDKSKKKWGRK